MRQAVAFFTLAAVLLCTEATGGAQTPQKTEKARPSNQSGPKSSEKKTTAKGTSGSTKTTSTGKAAKSGVKSTSGSKKPSSKSGKSPEGKSKTRSRATAAPAKESKSHGTASAPGKVPSGGGEATSVKAGTSATPSAAMERPQAVGPTDERVGSTKDGRAVYAGSRGGHFYINENGNKTYVQEWEGAKIVGKTVDGITIYEGPKGGQYYYNANGNKTYIPAAEKK